MPSIAVTAVTTAILKAEDKVLPFGRSRGDPSMAAHARDVFAKDLLTMPAAVFRALPV
jgi:hypothetical protein